MGCFDSNCCLTGLPIQYQDPIYAALMIPHRDVTNYDCYVAEHFQFCTLPISGRYDDYGNIVWNSIPEKQLLIVEMMLKLFLPAIEDHEEYSRNVFKDKEKTDVSIENLWRYCSRGDVELDPCRKRRSEISDWKSAGSPKEDMPFSIPYMSLGVNRPVKFCLWMCHKWAFENVIKLHSRTKNVDKIRLVHKTIKEHVDLFCRTYKIVDEILEKKYGHGVSKNDDCMSEWVNMTREIPHWVVEEQGGVNLGVYLLIKDSGKKSPEFHDQFVKNMDQFKKMLKHTALLCRNMSCIRKTLTPVSIVGQQHEDFEHIQPWTEMIAKKVQEKIAKREE